MNVNETIKKLDFDIKQIDDTIDILNYISNGNYLSTNGKQLMDSNIKGLWNAQHHLLALRAELLKEKQQTNLEYKTL